MSTFEKAILIMAMVVLLVITVVLVKPTFDLARINSNIIRMSQQAENSVNAQAQRQDKLEIRVGKLELEQKKEGAE